MLDNIFKIPSFVCTTTNPNGILSQRLLQAYRAFIWSRDLGYRYMHTLTPTLTYMLVRWLGRDINKHGEMKWRRTRYNLFIRLNVYASSFSQARTQ